MGAMCKITLFISSILVAFLFKCYYDMSKPLPAPELDLNEYWGPGDRKLYKEDTSIRPFRISYSEEVIQKLRTRLENTAEFRKPMEGVAFEYGFNTNKLQDILKYWRTTYLDKWTQRQEYLNKFPQFKTQIQGLDIHYIHVKPKVPASTKVIPIILLHGFPGSVREHYEFIPKLAAKSADKDFVFEVICPSLPGYGFSDASSKTGLGPAQMAVIMNNLMKRLGHEKYYIQGGDWGSIIGSHAATLFQDNVLGLHTSMCAHLTPVGILKMSLAGIYPKLFVEEKYVHYYYPVSARILQIFEESGYFHIQATKPDTIGTVLSDTPIGLAAYILEKFSTWTNPAYRNLPDGGLEKYFTKDDLLDNVMIYYLTNTITTAQRLYAEAFTLKQLALQMDRVPTKVPVACAKFQHELLQQADFILRDKYNNLVQSSHFDDGGHFSAMQLPDVLYKDVIKFMKKVL